MRCLRNCNDAFVEVSLDKERIDAMDVELREGALDLNCLDACITSCDERLSAGAAGSKLGGGRRFAKNVQVCVFVAYHFAIQPELNTKTRTSNSQNLTSNSANPNNGPFDCK